MRWYFVEVEKHHEEDVLELMKSSPFEAFLPKKQRYFKKQELVIWVERLLFPRTIMIASDFPQAEFTKQFNAKTADQGDLLIPVVITVYQDRSFSFVTKTPPAAVLLKKACKIQSGSGEPNRKKVATVSKADLQQIAETKMKDLNAASIEAAMSMIAGTARSMGIEVEE